jgi:signal transduction histidine kinase
MLADDAVPSARMRSLTRLARPTAHEVRGALSALHIHLELLASALGADESALRERGARYLGVLKDECARLQRLTEAFLALAALPDAPADGDTATLVAGVVEAVRPLATTRRVRMEATPVAPKPCPGPVLEVGRQRLLDVLIEAITVAVPGSAVHVDPAPGGGGHVQVRSADGACVDVPLLAEEGRADA